MHVSHSTRLVLALATVLLAGDVASARPGRGGHHKPGFFLRLAAGIEFGSASADDSEDTTLSGLGGAASFAIGATVTRGLALHADVFGFSVFEPTVEQNGRELGDADDTRASVTAIGIGLTGYIMPLNLYISGAIGAGIGRIHTRTRFAGVIIEVEEESDPGLCANLLIGKEWFVSRKWGLGLAGQVIFGSLPGEDSDTTLSVFGAGLLFSATFN